MVDQDLIERVRRLSIAQRLELIELLTHSLRGDLAAAEPAPAPDAETAEATTSDLAAIERLARSFNLDLPPDSSLHRILGVVPSSAVPMTKDEVRELITASLSEKYS